MEKQANCFGENLRRARRAAHLTQEALGAELAYSGKSVSKWESGESYPPTDLLPRLARVLGTDIEAFFRLKRVPRYFLGIDGGGTKCDYLLTDAAGRMLRAHTGESCAPSAIGVARACESLRRGISVVCTGYDVGEIAVFAGLAGGTTAEYRTPIETLLAGLGFAMSRVGSDAKNSLIAALGEGDGVIAIMGTGSAVFCTEGGKDTRYGGFGHLMGDPASGYAFGRAVLSSALEQSDGSGVPTLMTELVREQTGKHPMDLIAPIYEGGKRYIASFAPLFFEACRARDALALEILGEQLQKLARPMRTALSHFDRPVPLVLCGGLSREADLILPVLEKCLDGCSYSEIRTLNKKSVEGAAEYARLAARESNT